MLRSKHTKILRTQHTHPPNATFSLHNFLNFILCFLPQSQREGKYLRSGTFYSAPYHPPPNHRNLTKLEPHAHLLPNSKLPFIDQSLRRPRSEIANSENGPDPLGAYRKFKFTRKGGSRFYRYSLRT